MDEEKSYIVVFNIKVVLRDKPNCCLHQCQMCMLEDVSQFKYLYSALTI